MNEVLAAATQLELRRTRGAENWQTYDGDSLHSPLLSPRSCDGLINIFDGLSMETTGQYWYVPRSGEDPAPYPAGW